MRKENFTAILPVTCNAYCSFCPEKEINNKAKKDEWLAQLLWAIHNTKDDGYPFVSLSGGEPTLDLRLLESTIKGIYSLNYRNIGIGITTNGNFLESKAATAKFLQILSDHPVSWINLSRHYFSDELNNQAFGVNYQHSLEDVLKFRSELPFLTRFRLQAVVDTVNPDDYLVRFKETKAYAKELENRGIEVAFRSSYRLNTPDHLIHPELLKAFYEVFPTAFEEGGCPTCVSHRDHPFGNIFLKGALFEPTAHEDGYREYVFHQDGKLYYDWSRQQPVQLAAPNIDQLVTLLTKTRLVGPTNPDSRIVQTGGDIDGLPSRSSYGDTFGCGYRGC